MVRSVGRQTKITISPPTGDRSPHRTATYATLVSTRRDPRFLQHDSKDLYHLLPSLTASGLGRAAGPARAAGTRRAAGRAAGALRVTRWRVQRHQRACVPRPSPSELTEPERERNRRARSLSLGRRAGRRYSSPPCGNGVPYLSFYLHVWPRSPEGPMRARAGSNSVGP